MRFDEYLQDDPHGWATGTVPSGVSGPAAGRARQAKRQPAGRQCAWQPAHDGEEAVFRALGLGKPSLAEARRRARINATTLERELMAAGLLDAPAYYEALARILGLAYLPSIPPETVIVSDHMDVLLRRPSQLRIELGGRTVHAIVPEARRIDELRAFLDRHPALRPQVVVTTPVSIREAVWRRRAITRARETVRKLFERDTGESARIVLTGAQGFALGLLASAFVIALLFAHVALLTLAHVVLSIFFSACIALRIGALACRSGRRARRKPAASEAGRPVYTVVVALHHEANVVGQLVESLGRLQWPRSLLDIKLVCEADDDATLRALEAMELPCEYEIVRVPPIGPRTKPKALSYALPGARGRFLVVYDAEDRPHPEQLAEAYTVFQESDDRLACLQAPLVISNASRSGFSAVFAMEYAGLFRGLLPCLAHFGLPLPLGGTSNHFRMEALRAVGGWDPHNVTEDADLGMRLFRHGYRGGVLSRATQEEAPETVRVWMNQRTRWFKGWLQTWLVMMRAPQRLWREMGPCGFLSFQVLIAGMLFSALGHPLLLCLVGNAVYGHLNGHFSFGSPFQITLSGVDIWNFLGGYLVFVVLAWQSMVAEERRRIGWRWWWVPVYWVALSFAAWRAVYELIRNPFYWAKTPHAPRRAPLQPEKRYRRGFRAP